MSEERARFSAAEFNRRFGEIQMRAARGPVLVTHHGRPKYVLLAVDHYEGLRGGQVDRLNESSASLRLTLTTILDNISEGYFSVDRNWHLITVNRAAEYFLGDQSERMEGRPWEEVFPTARGSDIENVMQRAIVGGEVSRLDTFSTVHPNRRISVTAFPMPDGGAGLLFANKTEHYRLSVDTRVAEAKFQALLDAFTDRAIFIETRSRLISAWGAGATALLGWHSQDVIGKPVDQILLGPWTSDSVIPFRTKKGDVLQMKELPPKIIDGTDMTLRLCVPMSGN